MLSPTFALRLLLILQFLSLIHSSIIPSPRPFNLSHFLPPKVTTFIESTIPSDSPNFLQGVLDAIANKEKWALEDVRVAGLDTKKAKYRPIERYLFRIRIGKTEMVLKMYEQVSEWKRLGTLSENGTSSFEDLARRKATIHSFKIVGPFELRAARDDDWLTLMLPLNTSYSGLRRITVGEGITVEVRGAEEISLFHPSGYHLFPAFTTRKSNKVESIWPAICKASLPVRVLGSASVVAYRSQRPATIIKTAFPSRDVVNLLPDKCNAWPNHKKPNQPFSSLLSRITLMKEELRKFLNEKGEPDVSMRARIRASYIFNFQLQLERDVRSNDTRWSTLAEWRTKPIIEQSWFEVLATIEGEILKPQGIKRVRPFIATDSLAWSSLLSNISFTKFPSTLVPSEALTLDVKW